MKIVSINHTCASDIRKALTASVVEYLNTLKFTVKFDTQGDDWELSGADALGAFLIVCYGSGYDEDSFGVIFTESKGVTRPYAIRPIPDLDGNYTEGVELAPAYFDEGESAKAFQVWDESEWVKLTPVQEIDWSASPDSEEDEEDTEDTEDEDED